MVVAVSIHSDPEAHAGTQHHCIPEACKMDTSLPCVHCWLRPSTPVLYFHVSLDVEPYSKMMKVTQGRLKPWPWLL